jgi:hypothetical protein
MYFDFMMLDDIVLNFIFLIEICYSKYIIYLNVNISKLRI